MTGPLLPSELSALRKLAEYHAERGDAKAKEDLRLLDMISALQQRLTDAETVLRYYADDAMWPWDQGMIARLYFEKRP